MNKMIIVSGLSGAGKSVALRALEDLGYYCVDNLPINILSYFVEHFAQCSDFPVAVALDSRNGENIRQLPALLPQLRNKVEIKLLFLTADQDSLIRRYSQTRRAHPLAEYSDKKHDLGSNIHFEQQLLGDIRLSANLLIDSSHLSPYDLRDTIHRYLGLGAPQALITVQSFGFKNGIPLDADFVFDVRFLPNPYWIEELRQQSGLDPAVIEFMQAQPQSQLFIEKTVAYLIPLLTDMQKQNQQRAYITIAIGCTGGHHRSVYIAEQLCQHLKNHYPNIQSKHRDLVQK